MMLQFRPYIGPNIEKTCLNKSFWLKFEIFSWFIFHTLDESSIFSAFDDYEQLA